MDFFKAIRELEAEKRRLDRVIAKIEQEARSRGLLRGRPRRTEGMPPAKRTPHSAARRPSS